MFFMQKKKPEITIIYRGAGEPENALILTIKEDKGLVDDLHLMLITSTKIKDVKTRIREALKESYIKRIDKVSLLINNRDIIGGYLENIYKLETDTKAKELIAGLREEFDRKINLWIQLKKS